MKKLYKQPICQVLENQGIGLTELARALGVTIDTIQNWAYSKCTITDLDARLLSEYLEVPVPALFEAGAIRKATKIDPETMRAAKAARLARAESEAA